MSKNLSELSGRKGLTNNLFEKIGDAATEFGTPSAESLEKLANEFLIGKANTYGTTSFYDFTKEENKGKKVYVCNGSACVCAGKQDEVKLQLEKHFDTNEIGHMTCLGRCYENAAFHYNGKNYSGNDIKQFKSPLAPEGGISIFSKSLPSADGEVGGAVLTAPLDGFEQHYSLLKTSLKKSPGELLNEIKKSNIRGRG